jgi:hypothetical protein
MKNKTCHIVFYVLTILLLSGTGMAQQIKFGLYAGTGITLTKGSVDELNFNSKQTVITGGNIVSISDQNDQFAAVLAIEGRADLDVTVEINAPATLDIIIGASTYTIPVTLGFAYSNLNSGTDVTIAKTVAVQVPSGFNYATFPIWRRNTGPPGPPPTPDHSGYSHPVATAYLFIYGTLGPVPFGAPSGEYTGEIDVRVEYSTYD